jgi:hypothetical protein
MKISVNLKSIQMIGMTALFAAGLAACDQPGPGPAETAGKKIDQSADDAGRKIGEATDKLGDKLEQQGEKAGEAIDKLGEKLERQGEKAGVAIDDTEITAKAKAAIFAEPGLRTLQISVDTVKGVVTLSGSVDTQENSERTAALAGAVAGVNGVQNLLVQKPAH